MLSNEDKKDVARVLGAKTARKVSTATNDSKSKALRKMKEGERYIPAPMPKNFHEMTHSERVDYYKNHRGSIGSTKVNPKTGKYFDTY